MRIPRLYNYTESVKLFIGPPRRSCGITPCGPTSPDAWRTTSARALRASLCPSSEHAPHSSSIGLPASPPPPPPPPPSPRNSRGWTETGRQGPARSSRRATVALASGTRPPAGALSRCGSLPMASPTHGRSLFNTTIMAAAAIAMVSPTSTGTLVGTTFTN